MKWTDYVQAVGSIATVGALLVAVWVGYAASRHAEKSARQAEAYAGAQSAIDWRARCSGCTIAG